MVCIYKSKYLTNPELRQGHITCGCHVRGAFHDFLHFYENFKICSRDWIEEFQSLFRVDHVIVEADVGIEGILCSSSINDTNLMVGIFARANVV